MKKDNIIDLENSVRNTDVLTGLLRSGAREFITKTVQSELTEFLSQNQGVTDYQGRPLVVTRPPISSPNVKLVFL